MSKPSLSRGTLIALFGTLALVNLTACSNNKTASLAEQTANSVSNFAVASAAELGVKPRESSASPQAQPPQPSNTGDSYQQAIDFASGAVTISKSAVSREDWSLVANHWQKAINLLKAVPSSSRQYKTAQKKLTEYKGYLADAKLRATPQLSKPCSGETNPAFFSVPIKGRIDGIPIVEVTINEQKFDMLFDTGASKTLVTGSMAATLRLPVAGIGRMKIADGSLVILPVALVKSQEIDGRYRMDVPVAVAPPQAAIGLLGQDFYKGYNVAVKEDVIEFRRRGSVRSANQRKTSCVLETKPKFFRVPITGRKNDIPIVKVTFNDKYTFPMLFDTGASDTVITYSMAVKMELMPVGITQAEIADGSIATFGVALVQSEKIAGRTKRDTEVMVAPPAMDIGLLGQDFFEGYNYTIKQNVIEFHRQEP
jgi:predicted aspartyl protease